MPSASTPTTRPSTGSSPTPTPNSAATRNPSTPCRGWSTCVPAPHHSPAPPTPGNCAATSAPPPRTCAAPLNDANTPADRAFTLYHLAQLAFDNGDPKTALAQINVGLRAAPGSAELLEGRAKAEAALGNTDAALADYASAVAKVPQPSYVLELGELLQSLGRNKDAEQQYQVFRGEETLFTDNGVAPDSDQTLFEADHGDPAKALTLGESGLRTRPFIEMHDAYAWALHLNGRDTEALDQSRQATALGTRNALFHYHQGMIEKALGHPEQARTELRQALTINDHFNPLQAPTAQAALQELGTNR
ncbi:tetratricopeptide repeat protein [Streptomyces rubellomurinus]|uniref:tetratricopeptide repeat protein n=1 Tax=Streptomyces rubellomurinus (strain ATCC 31215) TaxID=359131 RepID=UPI001FC913B1|nr:tetratricopeptide repeat protein [Streptomyces rubellomurinus]